VFTNETTEALPAAKQFFNGDTDEKLCDVTITPDMVYKKLNKLKMNKAPGVDFVGTKMLVELSGVISEVVAILYNKLLTTAEIPNDWELANVTPVFKKSSKSSPANYRPISLTVNLCKVLESLIRGMK